VKTKEYRQVFNYKETNCLITADSEVAIDAAVSSIKYHRSQLEKYVRGHQRFLYSLQPIHVDDGPLVVKLMAEAAEKANVGPMAAVAGVLADLAVESMTSNGAELAIVEDGGEVSAISNRPVNVALSAGDSPLSRHMGFRLESFPTGVATSSGMFSHALSLGEADAVTVFAINAGIADAAATAVCNVVKGKDRRKAVELGIDEALSIEEVKGAFIIYRRIVGRAGQVPQIIKVTTDDKNLDDETCHL